MSDANPKWCESSCGIRPVGSGDTPVAVALGWKRTDTRRCRGLAGLGVCGLPDGLVETVRCPKSPELGKFNGEVQKLSMTGLGR